MTSYLVKLIVDNNAVASYVVENAETADEAHEHAMAHVRDVMHLYVGPLDELDERAQPVYLDAEADGE